MKRILGCLLCMSIILSCINFSYAEDLDLSVETIAPAEEYTVPTQNENISKEYLQYFVKWDDEKAPEEVSITEEEYLANCEMDKNDNGIWDVLEDEEEEDEFVSAASIETGILGDLNGDMVVDNKDVILMYRHIAGWTQDINTRVLDFNGDGYTNIADANHLMKYVSGWQNTILYSGKKYDIIYHVLNESMYQETKINNDNQDYYYSSDGLSLKNITADGYIFEGWFDGEGSSAERIRRIDPGETGEIELYARWTPRQYKVEFVSPMPVDVAPKYYTIETGTVLSAPSLSNYIFVGWTNQADGRLVNGIPKGTFGHMTLVANWASRRNQAKPVKNPGDPIIAEDTENGKIVFIYKIGDIENVPLFTLYRFSTAEGIATSVTVTEQTSISVSDAQNITQTIANATTDSATWTLSEGWNESTSVSEESAQQAGMTRQEAETLAKSSTNTFRLDSSVTESEVVVDSSQYAYKTNNQTGGSISDGKETGQKFGLSVDVGAETEMSAGVKLEGVLDVGAKKKYSLDVGADYENYGKNTSTSTDTWNDTIEDSWQDSLTTTNSKTWNNSFGYSNSNTMSSSRTTSQQISELITNKYGYGQSYSKNGNQSSGQAFTTQNTQQDSYSNTVTYNTSTLYTKEIGYSTDGKVDGYYRQVLAGTAHVFAVVGYDVATRSYFANSFTVMDDETYEFLDYSKTTPNFDDYEMGVLPFEVPVFVNDYVNARISHTRGLQINIDTGKVTGYDGQEPIVVVPSYVDIDNKDGTYSSVKITGIDSNAFKNNKTLRGIMLSEFITEIPASAFEGCTNLRDVYIPSLNKIGNRAFYGCTSLSKLSISEDVVSMGENAFYNVNNIEVTASNNNVALAAVNSGAKNVVLNVSSINSKMKDAVLDVPSSMNSFEIRGERKQYENLRVRSNAATTTINGINFVNCMQVPLELHSTTVNLNQTTVSAAGYCMILAKNTCKLNLFGTNQMNSSSGSAIVCGTTTFANVNSGVQASMQVSGNVYVYGNLINNDKYLNLTSGSVISITQEEFNQYISGVYQLVYDANGGTVSETEKTAYSGVPVGALPTPTWKGHTFDGWYTAASGGTKVTDSSTFTSSSTVTIYAHWTANTYKVTFNVNGGASVSTASKNVTYASTYGTLATATWDGHTFDGWFTSAEGGTKITSSTKVSITAAQTLYAHWTLNPESDWVRADQVPEGAIITQTSYSYRETAKSASSTMSGFTADGFEWRQTGSGSNYYASFPSGFKTSHSIYTSYLKSKPTTSETETSKHEITKTYQDGWVYWHWAYNVAYAAVTDRIIDNVKETNSGFAFNYFYAIASTVDCPYLDKYYCNSKSLPSYNCHSIIPSGADKSSTSGLQSDRFFRFNRYKAEYIDYVKDYKFYKDVSYSATDPGNASNISNKVTYVKYRAK